MKGKKIDLSNMTTLLVLIVLCVLLAIMSPVFLTGGNLINILQQVTVNGVLAVGISIVIFTGGIDISVGSILALVGIIMGKLMVDMGVHPLIAMPVGILVGAACGTFNGLMIARFKLQPMIATLGMMSMARGAALTIANGKTITGYSAGFRWIGSGMIPGTKIPVQIIFMLILYAVVFYIMKYRKFGRYIYAIGGNEEATRLSGINVTKYKMLAYTVSGITCALASIILVSKLNSAQSSAGEGYEMDAIASAVIGGASLTGGFGSIWGTLLGAVIIGVIRNGLNLLNVSSYLQQLILGAIIIAAVLFDSYKNRKK
ncbi:ABC transporter permease [Ruminococcus gauvreauii]|uniref:ABC transporter permease n=1 Tax=Ruminococcus gauvreauii TaxID=438033 RepID=A0ABY5VFM0_9FIRM|nr:ABC transporter permease [Ruminococcus gauvreauii]UWP58278.1 ABC transporter permease [Ruminococcus gauvreauii]